MIGGQSFLLETVIDVNNFSIGDSLLVALIGILIVFAILLIIIGYLWLQSKVFSAVDKKKTNQQKPAQEPAAAQPAQAETASNDDEIAAVISACIYAMLDEDETVPSDAEFVIRKIEKLNWSK